LTEMVW